MSRLSIVSVASGYGGAERSIEIITRHLPPQLETTIYGSHPEHLARLHDPANGRDNLRIRRLRAADDVTTRRIEAMKLVLDDSRQEPQAILANTQASALLCAMAARVRPAIAQRTSLYVRDFLWTDLAYIFSRLGSPKVLVPDAVVARRLGYLAPSYLWEGHREVTVLPDMVELSDRPVSYEGPVLHLATVNPWKGHHHLLLAVSRLKRAGRQIELTSVGQAPEQKLLDQLKQVQQRLELEQCFRFGEYVSDPAEILSRCRAVVVSSVSHSGGPETFGRTIIEAWAHRKPVVAFATGAPAGLIEHEVDGLLVPPEDTEALADVLHRLWSDAALSKRLGEAGRRKAEQLYSAGGVTRQLMAILGLVEPVRQPPP
jgi:glycosyltransferase involved in cell wall biosynthesis